ncbi:hypothetical protein MMC25_005587 [Agyrium rufum]|nr:hypothetical protein [Agyrium rufum]
MLASSPPASPEGRPSRPLSAIVRPSRPQSRTSVSSRTNGSRASDEDGRTSVRVAVRVRPPLRPGQPGYNLIPPRFQTSTVQVTSPTTLTIDSPQGKRPFVFDRVFGEDVDQEGVWEYLQESVSQFVQGYNVSLLAYGQSGAGKSFTMGTSGPAEQSDSRQMGVVPRAARMLFESLSGPPPLNRNSSGLRMPSRYSMSSVSALQGQSRQNQDQTWQMKVTYVEIYNEQLRDLLVPEEIAMGERSTVTIREDPRGRIIPTGLHQVTVNSVEELLDTLNFGSSIRQTDSTALNAKSSRSHAVFSINLVQKKNKSQTSMAERRMSVPVESLTNPENWVTIDSKLHFVDLAGSERMKNTGASGERAREGININVGLASLGKVIAQLSSRQAGSHVSYRDSKLTRLLQDSLGGNAITYMIACVTPAEFHLSETLNTVRYAQSARAIQSKPRIQQVSDESDKQGLIERLRAEVSFLRAQMRDSDLSERLGSAPQERVERQHEREIELQNHLLDSQESYSALSQRHAKLISEIARSRELNGDGATAVNGVNTNAVDRLKRSNSFAEAVEQMVLEYEKTIQSLETSLSNTRSTLSSTESSLLERETRCAFIESMNQQLQSRQQQLLDRENSTEQYLHDLEARVDGHSSGDDKNVVIMTSLRKEIARMREVEGGNEEYIATLEERLAEAEQDMELMSREVSRLEHVVERQRSLGKLDSLLHELDNASSARKPPLTNGVHVNGISKKAVSPTKTSNKTDHDLSLKHAIETAIPESDDGEDIEEGEHPPEIKQTIEGSRKAPEADIQSPAQFNTVSDKLDTTTRELLALRNEHESTVSEYQTLSQRFEEALRQIAQLESRNIKSRADRPSEDESTPLPTPVPTIETREEMAPKQSPTSRLLSFELNSGHGSPTRMGHSRGPSKQLSTDSSSNGRSDESFVKDSRRSSVSDVDVQTLHDKYIHLQEQHLDTLDLVEELKAEVQKTRMSLPLSPTSPIIRRKSSQTMAIDRAHRSLASLGNIAAENFEDKPDTMQNFEMNLNTAMHELHQRSERVQALEAELGNLKKEMEMRNTIISGLTRERSSLKSASPMDVAVISSMRDQLVQSQNEIKALQERHAAREEELLQQRRELERFSSRAAVDVPGSFPQATSTTEQSKYPLENEIRSWQEKHESAVASLEHSEQTHKGMIAQLEASLKELQSTHSQGQEKASVETQQLAAAVAAFEQERDMQSEAISSLRIDLANHKSTIDSHLKTIANLQEMNAALQAQVEEGHRFEQDTLDHLEEHRGQISWLEQQVAQHQSAVEFHKHGLKSLHDSHAREIDELRTATFKQANADADSRITELTQQHQKELKSAREAAEAELIQQHQKELKSAREAADADLHRKTQDLQSQILDLEAGMAESGSRQKGGADEVADIKARLATLESAKKDAERTVSHRQAQIEELSQAKRKLAEELENTKQKEQRASRLVEELEGQLTTSFEDGRAASGRLSLMQNTRDSELAEARAATMRAQEEIAVLTTRLEQIEGQRIPGPMSIDGNVERSNSMTNNALRKSGSIPSLPSPPPAIPLPPLPNGKTSPPPPQPSSKELNNTQLIADQEARIRTIEKHLYAEKQLTATLEEALGDLETQGNRMRKDVDAWKAKAKSYEDELVGLRRERNNNRLSVQAVEEERNARRQAEAAKAQLEERMAALNRKKKKSGFNCF